MSHGIEALNVYGGLAAVDADELAAGRGLDPARLGNVRMTARSVALPFEDPVTNAVNAAAPLVDALDDDRASIELLVVATESGLDYSKSLSSYVHRYLDLAPRCRVVELKQACYSATAGLQLAVGQLASGRSPGARALVIAADVAVVDEEGEYAELATGTGGVAMMVGEDARVLEIDPGAYGLHSFETMDSARPLPDRDIVDVDQSLLAYLTCATGSFLDYQSAVEGADLLGTFDYLALHTPFPGMVKAAHRKLLREVARVPADRIEADFERRVAPSLVYPSLVGNLFAGSLYLALASLVDTVQPTTNARIGLFSYGSGCASEFFSGLIGPGSADAVGGLRIAERLENRLRLDFAEYVALLARTRDCLVPYPDREVDLDDYADAARSAAGDRRVLALAGVKDFHRHYEWL